MEEYVAYEFEDLTIPKDNVPELLADINALSIDYSEEELGVVIPPKGFSSLEEALSAWNIVGESTVSGGMDIVEFIGKEEGTERTIFKLIAEYAEPGFSIFRDTPEVTSQKLKFSKSASLDIL